MIPDRYAPQVYCIFRIVFGMMFLSHGLQKMFGMFGGIEMFGGQLPSLTSEPGIAGAIEVALGLLIMLGLFTRVAAFFASGEMAVAYFKAHQRTAFWPLENRARLRCCSASLSSTWRPGEVGHGASTLRWYAASAGHFDVHAAFS